ncbi:hypothetical protein [Kocuria sp.]|uniref:hypothetical protein n=1 Tax=Kocuria sp. TaxID=1871328 RepID=UPI0026DADA4A|nr:hypothetical protein [Kocuria sp.]MDO4918737.1 hypothetical protein [Kocuria sp.]
MSRSWKVGIAAVLGALVVLTIVPTFAIVGWGEYSNSLLEDRISRQEFETQKVGEVTSHVDRSYFKELDFYPDYSDDSVTVSGTLKSATLKNPAAFVAEVNSVRGEVSVDLFFSLVDDHGKRVLFVVKDASRDRLTVDLLKRAFRTPGEPIQGASVVTIDLDEGEVVAGRGDDL